LATVKEQRTQSATGRAGGEMLRKMDRTRRKRDGSPLDEAWNKNPKHG